MPGFTCAPFTARPHTDGSCLTRWPHILGGAGGGAWRGRTARARKSAELLGTPPAHASDEFARKTNGNRTPTPSMSPAPRLNCPPVSLTRFISADGLGQKLSPNRLKPNGSYNSKAPKGHEANSLRARPGGAARALATASVLPARQRRRRRRTRSLRPRQPAGAGAGPRPRGCPLVHGHGCRACTGTPRGGDTSRPAEVLTGCRRVGEPTRCRGAGMGTENTLPRWTRVRTPSPTPTG